MILFYYDCLSPYSYIASLLIRKKPLKEVIYKPVSLPSIMHKNKNTPPATIPNKAAWIQKDLQRLSEMHEFKIRMPPIFPFSTKYLGAAIASQPVERQEEVTKVLFEKIFVENDLKNDPSQVQLYLQNKGIVLDEGWQEKGLSELEKNTKEALEHGAFGVPSFVIIHNNTPELFFGSDRLDQISFYYSKM